MAEQELGAASRSTAAAPTWSSPTTRTRSPSPRRRGRPLARIWMHNGMIETGAEKMSKSDGNIFQLSEALDRYGREAVVAYLISGHYRQPLAFGRSRWRRRWRRSSGCGTSFGSTRRGARPGEAVENSGEAPPSRPAARDGLRSDALADDFNTPRAMARCSSWSAKRIGARSLRRGRPRRWRRCSSWSGSSSLGQPDEGAEAEAERLMEEREEARAAKDFERADEIRDELAELGWEVRDSRRGPRRRCVSARR